MKHAFRILALMWAVGSLISEYAATSAAAATNPPAKLTIQATPLKREIKAATSYAPVVKKVAPCVVNIYSTMTIRERPNANPFLQNPFFRDFFGDQFQPRERKEQSLGSGIIVTADGYILTANHVIEGADKVRVSLATGEKEYDAKIIGADPKTEVGVLKIDSKGLPAAVLADSDQLEVGDAVLAIGNPFAVGQTVTMGIVSAIGRGGFGVTGEAGYENFIQTDAAINPGNSGGALIDAEGRLVGINTWIISGSGGNQGIGFAVPINMARYVMDRLTQEGRVTRSYLGLYMQEKMTQELARQFKLPGVEGALVTRVEPDSPAAMAGFKEGDFVVEFNAKKINDMRQLRLMASETAPGTKVDLKLWRDGKEKTLNVTMAPLPEDLTARGSRPRSETSQAGADLLSGVEVADLDPRASRELGIPGNIHGAIVTEIAEDSNAANAGLRPRDVIVEIDRKPVRDAEHAVALCEKASGDQVLLRVWRGSGGRGTVFYLPVDNRKHR